MSENLYSTAGVIITTVDAHKEHDCTIIFAMIGSLARLDLAIRLYLAGWRNSDISATERQTIADTFEVGIQNDEHGLRYFVDSERSDVPESILDTLRSYGAHVEVLDTPELERVPEKPIWTDYPQLPCYLKGETYHTRAWISGTICLGNNVAVEIGRRMVTITNHTFGQAAMDELSFVVNHPKLPPAYNIKLCSLGAHDLQFYPVLPPPLPEQGDS